MAATTSVTEMVKICAKAISFSVGVLRKQVEATTEAMKEKRLPDGFPSAKLHEEASHEGSEQSQTSQGTNLGDELGQVQVRFLLKRDGVRVPPGSYKIMLSTSEEEPT